MEAILTSMEAKSDVTFFVTPARPLGWTATPWKLEVESRQQANLTPRQMSLSVLNEFRELNPGASYPEFGDLRRERGTELRLA
jgi:hypothetical protein